MARNKDLKRLVRARMTKTGEAYTAARTHLISKPQSRTRARADSAPAPDTVQLVIPTPKDYPALAGVSDETIKARTGCTWERWVVALDRKGAESMSHRDIAALVSSKYKIDGWWAQSVTVGYERIKGLRARGQRRDGTYEANKSRTYNVPVTVLFDAWANARIRRQWLDADGTKVRTATAPKSIRLGWTDRSIIAVGFIAKGKSKSSVALAHTKLPDKQAADRLKAYWTERLNLLGEVLEDR